MYLKELFYISSINLKLKNMKIKNLKHLTRKQLDKLFNMVGTQIRTEIDDALSGNSCFKTKEDMIYFLADACEDFDILCPIHDKKLWKMRKWTKYNLMYYVAVIRFYTSKPHYIQKIGFDTFIEKLDSYKNRETKHWMRISRDTFHRYIEHHCGY